MLHIYIIGHDQTQLNQVCYFYFFGVFLISKRSNYSELFIPVYKKKALPSKHGLVIYWQESIV